LELVVGLEERGEGVTTKDRQEQMRGLAQEWHDSEAEIDRLKAAPQPGHSKP
jgi:hypothetical protein